MIRTMSRREWLDRYQSDVFQRDDWNEQVGIQKHNPNENIVTYF